MPNTITSYNTFVANTTIRSSEVNANFSNHRGTLIPIHESTATAGTTGTYDLGSSEYTWLNAYLNNSLFADYDTTTSIPTPANGFMGIASSGQQIYQVNDSGTVSELFSVSTITEATAASDDYILTQDVSNGNANARSLITDVLQAREVAVISAPFQAVAQNTNVTATSLSATYDRFGGVSTAGYHFQEKGLYKVTANIVAEAATTGSLIFDLYLDGSQSRILSSPRLDSSNTRMTATYPLQVNTITSVLTFVYRQSGKATDTCGADIIIEQIKKD